MLRACRSSSLVVDRVVRTLGSLRRRRGNIPTDMRPCMHRAVLVLVQSRHGSMCTSTSIRSIVRYIPHLRRCGSIYIRYAWPVLFAVFLATFTPDRPVVVFFRTIGTDYYSPAPAGSGPCDHVIGITVRADRYDAGGLRNWNHAAVM